MANDQSDFLWPPYEAQLVENYLRRHKPEWLTEPNIVDDILCGLVDAAAWDSVLCGSPREEAAFAREAFFSVFKKDPDFSLKFMLWYREQWKNMTPIRRYLLFDRWPGDNLNAGQIAAKIEEKYGHTTTADAVWQEMTTLRKKKLLLNADAFDAWLGQGDKGPTPKRGKVALFRVMRLLSERLKISQE
jgi:hypothetical protein